MDRDELFPFRLQLLLKKVWKMDLGGVLNVLNHNRMWAGVFETINIVFPCPTMNFVEKKIKATTAWFDWKSIVDFQVETASGRK